MSDKAKLPSGVHPIYRDIRSLPPDEVRPFLRGKLDRESASPDPDLDGLMLLGNKARSVPPTLVDAELMDWTSRPLSVAQAEVVAWFLVGYWNSASQIPDTLITRIADVLDSGVEQARIRDPLVLATSFAYAADISAPARECIHEALNAVRRRVDSSVLPPYAAKAMSGVFPLG